jgi:hypothetical protein
MFTNIDHENSGQKKSDAVKGAASFQSQAIA